MIKMTCGAGINVGLLLKFRGSMIGALMGDCLGAPYEADLRVPKRVLGNYFTNLLSEASNPIFPFTDDTCMTLSVASSLVENGKVDSNDMAKRFVDSYESQPKRGYGHNVVDVFRVLKETNFQDVFLPAKLQFKGTGSYGNGAAMRISPIALAGVNKTDEELKKDVEDCSFVTHSHPNGCNGALLQCFAIHTAMKADPQKHLDPVDFIDKLEKRLNAMQIKEDSPYYRSLQKMKDIYLKQQDDITAQEISEYLGNDVAAHRSVPTAIYSFLRGLKPIPDFECENPFVRSLYFAISMGGDTDTIASMAGSIAGAYHGADSIPEVLQKRCEAIDDVSKLAQRLYETFKDEQ